MIERVKFGAIETRIRRDLLNDNDADQYRWGVAAVMSAMNAAVADIVERHNAWAGYDEFANRIATIHTARIEELCDGNPPSTELTSVQIEELRGIEMPLMPRYADAVAYIAAAKLYQTDDSDTANAQKAATYFSIGKETAAR